MSEPVTPADADSLLKRVAELERRLEDVERSPALTRSSIDGGLLELRDLADPPKTRFYLGEFATAGGLSQPDTGTRYGYNVRDEDGVICIEVVDKGFSWPWFPIPARPRKAITAGGYYVDVTSGSFESCFTAEVGVVLSDVLFWQGVITTDAGTTAQYRLNNQVVSGATTTSRSLAAASQVTFDFMWLHGQPLGSGPFIPTLEVRRTAGAGLVHVYWPTHVELRGSRYVSGESADG